MALTLHVQPVLQCVSSSQQVHTASQSVSQSVYIRYQAFLHLQQVHTVLWRSAHTLIRVFSHLRSARFSSNSMCAAAHLCLRRFFIFFLFFCFFFVYISSTMRYSIYGLGALATCNHATRNTRGYESSLCYLPLQARSSVSVLTAL
jgi:hypothetical protein